jgi:hypothetical protein
VFYFMARGAQGDQSFELLDMALVIIGPDFVTLYRPICTLSSTNFTNISGFMGGPFLEDFPDIRRKVGAYIGVPTAFRNKLNREERYPFFKELSVYIVWNVPLFAYRVLTCSEGSYLALVFFWDIEIFVSHGDCLKRE